ncbi:hypothetical protein [Cohnella candidum]|uniref:Uncharacterized protein n=1 Tax=Cohnella candidum TaxID=2674991 RepID=A0A3G3JWG3_9BACL|nr:hypothetical protein [Cohnella candidum]AYQ72534.1 hypothetical protein EAV92_08120 [Cohnella candidum]
MKLEQHELTRTVKGKIMEAERKFGKLCDELLLKYGPIAAEKQLDVEIALHRTGHDSFTPYYRSGITMDVSRKGGKSDTHRVVIWECQREFLGIPTKRNLPGSKVIGEYMDEPYEQVAQELIKRLESYLKD